MLGITALGVGNSYFQNPYSSVNNSKNAQRSAAAQAARTNGAHGATRTAAIPAAQPGTPVQPVTRVPAPNTVELDGKAVMRRWENDPAALSGRDRAEYVGDTPPAQTASASGIPQAVTQQGLPGADEATLPGTLQMSRSRGKTRGEDSELGVKLPGFVDAKQTILGASDEDGDKAEKIPGQPDKDGEKDVKTGDSKSAREVTEESECQTCKNRKYQDGSDDPGVSFKTPTHIDPDQAASAVQGHEMEHVVRNQAQREGRRVVSQSVTYHTAICPECGRVYVSGGTTRTVTAADEKLQEAEEEKTAEKADELKRKLIPGYDGKESGKDKVPGLDPSGKEKTGPVTGANKEDSNKSAKGVGADKSPKNTSGVNSGKGEKKTYGLGADKEDPKWTLPGSSDDKDDKEPLWSLLNTSVGSK